MFLDQPPVLIVEKRLQLERVLVDGLVIIIRDGCIDLQLGMPVLVIKNRADEEIGDMDGRDRIEIDLSEDPAKPPKS